MVKSEQNYLYSIDFDRLQYATSIISTREAMIQVLAELEGSDFPMKRVSVFPVDTEHQKVSQKADAAHRTITPSEGAKYFQGQ